MDYFSVASLAVSPHIVRRIVLSAVLFFVFLFVVLNQNIGQTYKILIALAPSIPAALLGLSIASAIAK
jgi:hypothetical protein